MVGIIAIIGALFGGLEIINTTLHASSAPQQAAGMAIACAYAIVPYVFARGVEMLSASRHQAVAAPPAAARAPVPTLSEEEAQALKAGRTRRFLIGGAVVVLLILFAAWSVTRPPRPQPTPPPFSEQFP